MISVLLLLYEANSSCMPLRSCAPSRWGKTQVWSFSLGGTVIFVILIGSPAGVGFCFDSDFADAPRPKNFSPADVLRLLTTATMMAVATAAIHAQNFLPSEAFSGPLDSSRPVAGLSSGNCSPSSPG